MAKLISPVISLRAHGSIGDSITFTRSRHTNIAKTKPIPTDPYSLPQAYQRWLYQDYIAWWHDQSATTKQLWETNARPFHITGFSYWMRERLRLLPDIVGGYRLDRVSTGLAQDFSLNDKPLTVIGASPAKGAIGNAFTFDGTDDYCFLSTHAALAIPHISVTFFFNTPDITTSQCPASKWLTAGHNREWLFFITAGQLNFYVSPNGVSYAYHADATGLSPNTLYHVLGTFDGANIRLYINGLLIATTPLVSDMFNGTAELRLSSSPGFAASWYPGLVDHYIVYNRVLTSTDAQRHAGRRYP